jgi:hypothetical protein
MRASHVRDVWVAALVSLLAACGGGGDGGNGAPAPPVNAAPTIQNQTFSGTEDTPATGAILASDPGDTFTLSVVTNPANGTLTTFAASGQFTYTPAENFNGDDTFQVRVTDSANQTATAAIRVTLAAVNDPPTAANDVVRVDSGNTIAVLANDVDVDGDPLAVEIRGTPLAGTAAVNADRTVALTLPPGFKGFTKFDYRITDAAGITADATAQVFVGIAPFSVVFYGRPESGNELGIYLSDLFTTRLVHPPGLTGTFEQLKVSADGSALAYLVRSSLGVAQIWHVDVDNLGVQRPAIALSGFTEQVDAFAISRDGRYVATVGRTPSVGGDRREVYLLDSEDPAPASRISLDPAIHLASHEPKFNDAGTALYYLVNTGTPGESAVYKVTLATRTVTRVTPVLAAPAGASYISFWVSPDESRILHYRGVAATVREFWVTPGGQPEVQTLLHEPSVAEPFYPSIAPDFDSVALPLLSGPDEDQLKLARMSAPGTTVPAGPVAFVANIDPFGVPELLRWRHDSGAFLTCSPTQSGPCRLYEVVLDDLANPRLVNVPIGAQESASNGAYSEDGERISYLVDGVFKRELHVTTPASIGVASTLVSPAGAYVSIHMLDRSGRVTFMMTSTSASLFLVNLDAPSATMPVAFEVPGIASLQAVVPRWP